MFEIGPPGWFNAGALHGFDSRHIVVGPKVILLAESEDALAWLLGHEVAHITNHHTTIGAVQDLLVGTLEFTSKVALAVANAAACTQGSCMTGQELRDSMAGAATITGAVARGAINATGLDRDQEREADYYGLQYAVRAGYRPEAAVTVTRQMLAYEQGAGSSFEIPFLRDHPTWPERVVRVEKWVRAMGAGGVQTADVSRIPAESTTAPAPVSAAPSAGRGATSAAAAPQVIRPPSTCWQVGGADGQRCTTCCDEAGCRSRCEQGSRPTQVAASARPRSCWNVDSRIGGKAAVCTTCCTASVSCSTTCDRLN